MSNKINGLTVKPTYEQLMDDYMNKKIHATPAKTPALDYVNSIWFSQVDKEGLFNLEDSARKIHEAEKGLLQIKEEAVQTGQSYAEVKAKSNLLKTVGVRKKTKKTSRNARNDPTVGEPDEPMPPIFSLPPSSVGQYEIAKEYEQLEKERLEDEQKKRTAELVRQNLDAAARSSNIIGYDPPNNPAGDRARENANLQPVTYMDAEDRQPAEKRPAEPKAKAKSKAKAKTGDTAMKKKPDEEPAEAKARAKSKAKTKRGDEVEVTVLPKEEETTKEKKRPGPNPETFRHKDRSKPPSPRSRYEPPSSSNRPPPEDQQQEPEEQPEEQPTKKKKSRKHGTAYADIHTEEALEKIASIGYLREQMNKRGIKDDKINEALYNVAVEKINAMTEAERRKLNNKLYPGGNMPDKNDSYEERQQKIKNTKRYITKIENLREVAKQYRSQIISYDKKHREGSRSRSRSRDR
jgi:hypothetical protein